MTSLRTYRCVKLRQQYIPSNDSTGVTNVSSSKPAAVESIMFLLISLVAGVFDRCLWNLEFGFEPASRCFNKGAQVSKLFVEGRETGKATSGAQMV